MKTRKSLIVWILLLTLITVGILVFFNLKPKSSPQPGAVPVDYVVRLEGNTVNVYERMGESETYSRSVEGVNVFDLPQQTVDDLKKGIEVKDSNQLARLVEEITS